MHLLGPTRPAAAVHTRGHRRLAKHRECRARIGDDGHLFAVRPAERIRIEIDVHDARAFARILEDVGTHRTQLRANSETEIGGGERIVGNLARIAAASADRERVGIGDASLACHRGHDGNVQRFRERGEFRPSLRENDPAAGNQNRFLRTREQSDRALDILRERGNPERRSFQERCLRVNVGRGGQALVEPIRGYAEIDGPGHAADRCPHRCAQHVGDTFRLRQISRPLCDRGEHGGLLQFLILVAMASARRRRAAYGDERARGPVGIDNGCGQIRGAGTELHDAERRLAGHARVGIGHGEGRAFAAPEHHAHAFAVLHVDQGILRCAGQRENVFGAVGSHHFRQRLRYRQCVRCISRECARHSFILLHSSWFAFPLTYLKLPEDATRGEGDIKFSRITSH